MIAEAPVASPSLTLAAKTAADLMTPDVVAVPTTATVRQTVALLTEKKLSALAVVDADGQPVGVVSRSDVVAHDCATYEYLQPDLEGGDHGDAVLLLKESRTTQFYLDRAGVTQVKDIMTPIIISVSPQTA